MQVLIKHEDQQSRKVRRSERAIDAYLTSLAQAGSLTQEVMDVYYKYIISMQESFAIMACFDWLKRGKSMKSDNAHCLLCANSQPLQKFWSHGRVVLVAAEVPQEKKIRRKK